MQWLSRVLRQLRLYLPTASLPGYIEGFDRYIQFLLGLRSTADDLREEKSSYSLPYTYNRIVRCTIKHVSRDYVRRNPSPSTNGLRLVSTRSLLIYSNKERSLMYSIYMSGELCVQEEPPVPEHPYVSLIE